MRDLIVLYTGDIVYLSSISDDETFDPLNNDLLFFDNGRVRRFKKNGIAYMAIFDESNSKFNSYRPEINFWNNNKVNEKKNGTSTSFEALGERFDILNIIPHKVKDDENVILAHEVIYLDSLDNEDIKTDMLYRKIPYKIALPLSKTIDLHNEPSLLDYKFVDTESKTISSTLTMFYKFIKNKKFLIPNGDLKSINETQIDILIDVIQVFDWIYKQTEFINHITLLKLIEPFNQVINLSNRYNKDYGNVDIKYHTIYDEEYFARLRLGLIEFKYWLIQYKADYSKINPNDLIVYIVNIFDPVELSFLSYETKIRLLNQILYDNFWIIGNWGFNKLNEEQAILKIIRSIAKEESNGELNYLEIDDFMDFLNTIYDCNSNQTLYEVLYEKVNDAIVFEDDGKGNRGQLIKAIYNLWQYSKFNPYHDEPSIANIALNHFTYTPYNCLWKLYDPTISFGLPDYEAAPMIINYESEKKLLWYIDNFKFEFYNNKIIATNKDPNYDYQPYGVYNFFQPVSIKSVNAEGTIIRMPVLNAPAGSNPNAYIKNCIPAFYLMYVDELGDKSDAKETIGTAVNVALTFWGIGGVISNLRHIRNISLIARLGSLTAEEQILLWRGISGLASASEAFFGAASFFHDLATSSCTIYYNTENEPDPNSIEYKKYKQCQSIDQWLFALEMLSMSGDLLARRALKKASKNLAQNLLDDIPPQHRQVIDELAEIDHLLTDFLQSIRTSHPNIYARVNAFPNEEKKFAFMFDFENDIKSLNKLETNSQLMTEWDDVVDELGHYRREIDYLISHNRFTNKEHEVDHLVGFHNGSTTGGFDPVGAHTNTHIINGTIRDPSLPAPPGRPATTIDKTQNGHIRYKNIYFVNPTNGSLKKKSLQTVFNPLWTDSRIKGEMAVAFKNKRLKTIDLDTGTNIQGFTPPPQSKFIFRSFLSDGTEVEITMYNFAHDPVTNQVQRDHLGFFKLILN